MKPKYTLRGILVLLAVVAVLWSALDLGARTAGVRWYPIKGHRAFEQNVWMDGNLNVDTGITATAGGVTATAGDINAVAGTIKTAGTTRISNSGAFTGTTAAFTSTLTVSGASALNNNVTSTGTVTAEHLTSTDDATITDDLTVHGDSTLNGNVTTTGTLSAEHLTSTDDATIIDDLTVHGDSVLNGNVTSTGTVTGANVTATTAVLPDAAGGATLGSASLPFAQLYGGARPIITITTDTTLTAAQMLSNPIVRLAAAQDDTTITLTLEAASADFVGCRIGFSDEDVTAGADLKIQAPSTVTLNGGTAAKALVHGGGSTAVGYCELLCTSSTTWILPSPPTEAGVAETSLFKWRNDNS